MKFFHVYNDDCIKGLEINGFINKDTGFKIQHAFSVPEERQFNRYAAKDGKLYNIIKDGNYPFYVDRIAGGSTYYAYQFDNSLIDSYRELLGGWFLGFQMHESASNRRNSEWPYLIKKMGGKGPYDLKRLKEIMVSDHARLPDGSYLPAFSHDTPEYYSGRVYAESYADFIDEVREMFMRRLNDTNGNILPCDSYFLFSKLQNEMGMRSFMPEVGSQIPLMRIAVSLARGTARSSKKTWGTYYECWRCLEDHSYCMPCFNSDPINEWYLTQELHPDDFTSFGPNGGSSRLLQNRIYYYTLMSGADYISEEWGLNCSYTDMRDFSLSTYGETKKSFINTALKLQGIQAITPFAIVLPKEYLCVELPEFFDRYEYGEHRDVYMRSPLHENEKEYFGHIEDVLKLIFARNEMIYGNEGHVLTNSRFGDLFDIIYEDADDSTLHRYSFLIDASIDSRFARSNTSHDLRILESKDLSQLENMIHRLEKTCMPCFVDGLHWLVSKDQSGNRYLTIFNNEGNERSTLSGDVIHHEADRCVKVIFSCDVQPTVVQSSGAGISINSVDDRLYDVFVPGAGFVLLRF